MKWNKSKDINVTRNTTGSVRSACTLWNRQKKANKISQVPRHLPEN